MDMNQAVIELLQDESVIGVGTGSTVEGCIRQWPHNFMDKSYVVSSERTRLFMVQAGYDVRPLTDVSVLQFYIDGVDQIDKSGRALKGRGAAMTQEKLLASMSQRRIAMAQPHKVADVLDNAVHALPIEVIPQARSYVARCVMRAYPHAHIELRQGVKTDQGNVVLDLYGLEPEELAASEAFLKSICGVLDHGLFVQTRFDECWVDRGQDAAHMVFNPIQ